MKDIFLSLKKIKFLLLLCSLIILGVSCNDQSKPQPLRIVTEIDIGESQNITLTNGEIIKLKLLQVDVIRDSVRNAVRKGSVKVSVDGEEITINYNLPVVIGKVQIDCPYIKDYEAKTTKNRWSVTKDARIRLWPKGSPIITPGTFVYPIKQTWFAAMTQLGNEPTYVDWGEGTVGDKVYYHSGHDFGGAEGMDEIISATDGLVIAANNETLEGYDDFPGDIRVDVVYVESDLGWFIRYSHLDSTNPAIIPGTRVKMGQKIGRIGKQGGSGGWVHLHFELKNKETVSGGWGTEDAYPYVWEAYVNQFKPSVIAVARPHHLLWTGQETTLDGSKSKSLTGDITSYEWTFSDGTTAQGAVQKRSYEIPGEFSEILKVTDSNGNIDYDFAVVQVYDRENPEATIPVMQPAYHPSLNIKPGDPITFLVRTFNTAVGNEVWDFGDGSPTVSVKCETVDPNNFQQGDFAETVHSYSEPGHYIVSVEREDEAGLMARAHLHVVVGE